MKTHYPIYSFINNLIIITFLLSSCGQRNLTPIVVEPPRVAVNPVTGTAKLNYCLVEDEIVSEVKTIIMLDESGSNCANDTGPKGCAYPDSPDLRATDPNRTKRTSGLISFLEENEFEENEYFALMGFFCDNSQNGACSSDSRNGIENDDVAPPESGEGSSPNYTPQNEFHPFIRNLASEGNPFTGVVQEFADDRDDRNGTNFRKSLVQLRDSIILDAENAKKRYEEELENAPDPSKVEIKAAFYKIVFASDGAPTDTGSDNYQSFLVDFVKDQIVALKDDARLGDFIHEVVLSAAFYHHTLDSPDSLKARSLIEDLARAGNGKFLFFDTDNSDIDFKSLLDIPVRKVNTSQEFLIVNNLNTLWGWDEDNISPKILKDTDADGIEDSLELSTCIDKKDCDGNGVSDKVESFLFGGRVCKIDPITNQCSTDSYQIDPSTCQTEKGMLDTDNDGLTDCEEQLLNISDTGIGSYDHNKDQMPDGLALRFGLDLTKPEGIDSNRSQRNIHDDDDTMSNFDEIKHFTPHQFNNDLIDNLKPYRYTRNLIFNPSNPHHKCYELIVNDIPLSSLEDRIEVHLLQKQITGTGKLIYKRFEKKMNNGEVIFTEEDFE